MLVVEYIYIVLEVVVVLSDCFSFLRKVRTRDHQLRKKMERDTGGEREHVKVVSG